MGNRRYIENERPTNYFKEWRDYRGLTQVEVEKIYGWQQSRVSNLENGRATVTDHVLAALARAYDCKIGDLYEPPPDQKDPTFFVVGAAPVERGMFALREALPMLAELSDEVQEIIPRLRALDDGIGNAIRLISAGLAGVAEVGRAIEQAGLTLGAATKKAPEPVDTEDS